MLHRDATYKLAGIVELDDSYFGGPNEGGKLGRGTDKSRVIVGLSLNSDGQPEYIKIEVVDDVKSATILDFAAHNIV